MAYYDYSALAVKKNGSTITPSAVQVTKNGNTVQIFRLIANGTDIIHKYARTTITLTLAASMYVSSHEYTSCGSTTEEGSVSNVRLRFSWSASGDKTVSRITFNSYYVDVYNAASGGTRMFDCSVRTDTVANGETVTLSGTYKDLDSTLAVVRAYIQLSSMTVTFTDGTSVTVSIGGQSVSKNISNSDNYSNTDTFTANHTKNADIKEY